MNNTSSTADTPTPTTFNFEAPASTALIYIAYTLSSVELIVHPLVVAITVFNAAVLFRVQQIYLK